MKQLLGALAGAAALVMAVGACSDDDGSATITLERATTTESGSATETTGDTEETSETETTGATETTTAAPATEATSAPGATTGDAALGVVAALRDAGLGTLATAIEAAGVEEVIESEEFTLFAPNDDAFIGLDPDTFGDVLADPARIVDILRNHVVGERLSADELVAQGQVDTSSGEQLPVTQDGDEVTVGDATIVDADRDVAGVGVIHVIDSVLTLSD
jgi:transforming growth factor-beta-induced protein